MSDISHLYRSAEGIKPEPPNLCGVAMLILLIVAAFFLCTSCRHLEDWRDLQQEIKS